MNDGQLRVAPAVLRATCRSLSGAAGHLHSRLRSLDVTVTGMVAQWQGLWGGACGDPWQHWRRGAGDVEKALSIMAELLGMTARGSEG